jgi:long-chain acyl-CoA synthetase
MHPEISDRWRNSYPVDIKWESEIPDITLHELFYTSFQKYKDNPCLSFLGKGLTYAETWAAAGKFAKGLQQLGIVKGTRVGLCLPNTPFYVIAYYGVLRAGGIVVNFNPLYAEKEIEEQINDSAAEIMVTLYVKQVQSKIDKMLGRTPLKKIIACDLADALPPVKAFAFRTINRIKGWRGTADAVPVTEDATHVAFSTLLKNDGNPAPVAVTPDDTAVFQYTGGTTGVPKAAVLSHRNLVANTHQAFLWFTNGGKADASQERMLAVLPFFHVFSMTVQMNLTLYMGGLLIMLPRFELRSTLDTITKEKPTIFAGVPTLYKAIIDYPRLGKYDLSSLKLCVSGGAALPEAVKTGFQKITGLELVEGYGLSETSPIVFGNPVVGRKKTNSIGLPLPRTEVKLAPVDSPVPGAGEICVRGPQVMKQYWNRPDETAKVFDAEGFLHTGDVAYMDDDGYVFIIDRIKDMIAASGFKVFPRKVEDALLSHPAVSETLVFGIPDDYRGETVKAAVVLRTGMTVTPQELKEFLQDKLASYEMPKYWDFRASLPKTLIGKPDRKALKAEEMAKLGK